LASFADGYCAHLVAQGYSPRSAQFHLQLLAQLSGWMQAEGLDVAGLVPGAVERFWAERRRRGDVSRITQGRLRPLLGYLDGLGMLLAAGDVAPTELDRLLEQFCGYLVEERGLVAGSVRLYAGVARRFLTERSEPLADDLACLSGADVNAFVLRESRRVRPRTAETVVCALRALLRFLHVHGWIATPLATGVPSVPQRREDLPRGLPPGQVTRLLASCDRTTKIGCRDYAILMLLARLGLRSGEVAALQLDDVDWRAGEVVGCRCRAMSARRSPTTCGVPAHAVSDGQCFYARSLRLTACLAMASARWWCAPAGGRGSRRPEPTGFVTRSPPRCCGTAQALPRSVRSCATRVSR